jgi:hypothetical protein
MVPTDCALGSLLPNAARFSARHLAEAGIHRLTAWFMLSILDDPAMSALAFC